MFESVFVVFRVLVQKSYSAFNELLYKARCDLFFPLVQFFDCEYAFFVKELDEGIEERGGFKSFCGAGIDTGMGVEEAGGEVFMKF